MNKVDLETSERRLDRRRFLAACAAGAGMAPLLSLSRGVSAGSGMGAAPATDLCYGTRRVLGAPDFSYLGAMRLPTELSQFTYGALAARKVGGRLQFFMTGENSPNATGNWGSLDCVWEFADTQSYSQSFAQAPRASVLTKWGDIFQGRRISWLPDGQQIDLQYLLTRGMLWKNDRLYWTYYDAYNVSGREDWCIGLTDLRSGPGSMVARGPWRPDVGVKHAAYWLVDMPDGTLGVGAGLTSGNISSSWGPELSSGSPFPTDGTPTGFGSPNLTFPQRHVRYAFAGGDLNGDGSVKPGRTVSSMPRQGDYQWHTGSITEVDPAKNGGVGSFTQIDYVQSCVYIDLPDKHGVLFAGALGTGHIWYGNVDNCGHGLGNSCGGGQGPNATGFRPAWWVYDPDDCARVANGQIPANIPPTTTIDPAAQIYPIQLGCNKAFGGMHFDRETRRLYVAALAADTSIPGLAMPLMHVFQIS